MLAGLLAERTARKRFHNNPDAAYNEDKDGTTDMPGKLDRLINKWGIAEEYRESKSSMIDLRNFSVDFGEVPPENILELLPECLVEVLLRSDFMLLYDNAAPGNSYDAKKNEAHIKKTDDLLHEIGHGLWYSLIPGGESYERKAVVASLTSDGMERILLQDKQIPTMHRAYAGLVGAHSGQFLQASCPNHRMNDLEEHFARNFDYLMKGKPLVVLESSRATLAQCLLFYRRFQVVDQEFERFYKASVARYHGGQWVRRVPMQRMTDGDPIGQELIDRIKALKSWLGATRPALRSPAT